mmetsp:Transcript_42714/g.117920  ORF Transcript_42714/g.117920 Transcript_42714/m.117920 type:complete len:253 (-) Transcript_42714:743-1501(-)
MGVHAQPSTAGAPPLALAPRTFASCARARACLASKESTIFGALEARGGALDSAHFARRRRRALFSCSNSSLVNTCRPSLQGFGATWSGGPPTKPSGSGRFRGRGRGKPALGGCPPHRSPSTAVTSSRGTCGISTPSREALAAAAKPPQQARRSALVERLAGNALSRSSAIRDSTEHPASVVLSSASGRGICSLRCVLRPFEAVDVALSTEGSQHWASKAHLLGRNRGTRSRCAQASPSELSGSEILLAKLWK